MNALKAGEMFYVGNAMKVPFFVFFIMQECPEK